jgi:hypothetical protein
MMVECWAARTVAYLAEQSAAASVGSLAVSLADAMVERLAERLAAEMAAHWVAWKAVRWVGRKAAE